MLLEKYRITEKDTWYWRLAELSDAPDMVNLSHTFFHKEIENILTVDLRLLYRNLSTGILRQEYNPRNELILVARKKEDHSLMGYTWANRGCYAPFSADELAEAKFAQVNLSLTRRVRLTLVAQMIQFWATWCTQCHIPLLFSSSLRPEQTAYMNLHVQAGFILRGSTAYLRCF